MLGQLIAVYIGPPSREPCAPELQTAVRRCPRAEKARRGEAGGGRRHDGEASRHDAGTERVNRSRFWLWAEEAKSSIVEVDGLARLEQAVSARPGCVGGRWTDRPREIAAAAGSVSRLAGWFADGEREPVSDRRRAMMGGDAAGQAMRPRLFFGILKACRFRHDLARGIALLQAAHGQEEILHPLRTELRRAQMVVVVLLQRAIARACVEKGAIDFRTVVRLRFRLFSLLCSALLCSALLCLLSSGSGRQILATDAALVAIPASLLRLISSKLPALPSHSRPSTGWSLAVLRVRQPSLCCNLFLAGFVLFSLAASASASLLQPPFPLSSAQLARPSRLLPCFAPRSSPVGKAFDRPSLPTQRLFRGQGGRPSTTGLAPPSA
jgi:hypothetical protein